MMIIGNRGVKMTKEFEALEFISKNTETIKEENHTLVLNAHEVVKQALERLAKFDEAYADVKAMPLEKIIEVYKKDVVLEVVIKELEQIKNANPSEAMEKFNDLMYLMNKTGIEKIVEEYSATIKATLLKAQAQEKENADYKEALRIIFEKKVNMFNLKVAIDNNSLRLYNSTISKTFKHLKLTQEEFDLLKRYVK